MLQHRSSTRLPRQNWPERLAVVALVEEEAGLVLAARGDAELQPVLGDDVRRRRLGRPAVERLLLADVLLGELVEPGERESALAERP